MSVPGRQTGSDVGSPVALLITLVSIAATACFAVTLDTTVSVVRDDPTKVAAFLIVALALQSFSIELYGRSRSAVSVSAIGLLAAGMALGPGPALSISVVAALVQWARSRGLPHRAIFNAGNFALATGTAAAAYHGITGLDDSVALLVAGTIASGVLYLVVNTGLLCLALALAERVHPAAIWRDRFQWLTVYYLAFGPLALASALAYEVVGPAGLAAFTLPPALMLFSIRQYVERTRVAADEVRNANDELVAANEELARRNQDLEELFRFAAGLSARSHDGRALVAFAEEELTRVTGAAARVEAAPAGSGVALVSGGNHVGAVVFDESGPFDRARWTRLRDAILPQLATAVESSQLIQEVREQHLATIAALSRSIEAKDGSTGEHTERVATVAVELARRLGYSGSDLDAIEIGALLHDVGKIGVPEAILHKPGPLTEDEWVVMRRHPLVSEHILAGIGLAPIVLQIARSSHERFDGAGYPNGLSGEEIPLPARIVLVADALDALTSDRPYRQARRLTDALDELRAHVGTQFCPSVIAALENLYREQPELLGGRRLHAVRAVA